MHPGIYVVKDEHRALAAVLKGLSDLIDASLAKGRRPDFALLRLMLDYVENVPERLHHPKEDRYLFPALRRRDPDAGPFLDKLEAEHVEGRARMAQLVAAMAAAESGGPAELSALGAEMTAFLDFHWAHMNLEEGEVLPRAARALLDEDWREIDQAFLSNADPALGGADVSRYREMFRRIAAEAPAPVGVGPEL